MGVISKSGWTLVNVVASGLQAVGEFVENVKTAAETVVNAVKSGMEWISNNVLLPIVTEFRNIMMNFVEILSETAKSLIGISISSVQNGIQLSKGSRTLEIELMIDNLDIILMMNDIELFAFSNLFLFPSVEETLGVYENALAATIASNILNSIIGWAVVGVELNGINSKGNAKNSILDSLALDFITSILGANAIPAESDDYYAWMSIFQIATAASYLAIQGLPETLVGILSGNSLIAFVTGGILTMLQILWGFSDPPDWFQEGLKATIPVFVSNVGIMAYIATKAGLKIATASYGDFITSISGIVDAISEVKEFTTFITLMMFKHAIMAGLYYLAADGSTPWE